jgi:hypothetical protein
MANDFEKFKKMYKDGEVKMLANPPPMPGAAGIGGLLGGAVSTAGRKKLMDTLTKSRDKNAKIRDAKEGRASGKRDDRMSAAVRREDRMPAVARNDKRSGGTFTDKIKNTRIRERTPKEKEKFGALVKREDRMPAVIKREDRMPAVQGSRALVKREDRMPAVQGGRALVKRDDRMPVVQGSRSVSAARTRTFGDKGQGGRIVGFSNKGKLALGAGAAGTAAMLYNAADRPKASDNKANNSKLTSGARDDRASSGSSKADAFRAKQQGMKVDGSPTKPKKDGTKKAGDKSRVAGGAKTEKKMSNFERMKKRGYEKEGFGSRSMTSRGAESRVKKERSFKFKDLFAKKKK